MDLSTFHNQHVKIRGVRLGGSPRRSTPAGYTPHTHSDAHDKPEFRPHGDWSAGHHDGHTAVLAHALGLLASETWQTADTTDHCTTRENHEFISHIWLIVILIDRLSLRRKKSCSTSSTDPIYDYHILEEKTCLISTM